MADAVEDVMKLVAAEVEKATAKFPTWPTDPLHALAVLGEEFGELTKDMLQMVYEPHKTSRENIRKEAVQTAAMAVRLLASLDCYEYQRGQQHSQGGERYFIHSNGAAVFVKEGEYFESQGGLKEPWGKKWREVRAKSIEAARAMWQPEWDRNEVQR